MGEVAVHRVHPAPFEAPGHELGLALVAERRQQLDAPGQPGCAGLQRREVAGLGGEQARQQAAPVERGQLVQGEGLGDPGEAGHHDGDPGGHRSSPSRRGLLAGGGGALGLAEAGEGAAAREQLVGLAELDDAAALEHRDPVGARRQGRRVGDEERGAPLHEPAQAVEDAGLAVGVEAGGRLVEHQHRRVSQEHPGDPDALALPAREADAARAEPGVVALRQRRDEAVRAGGPGRRHQLVVGRRRPVGDVLGDAPREQDRLLQQHPDLVRAARPASSRGRRGRRAGHTPRAGRRTGPRARRWSTCRLPTGRPARAARPGRSRARPRAAPCAPRRSRRPRRAARRVHAPGRPRLPRDAPPARRRRSGSRRCARPGPSPVTSGWPSARGRAAAGRACRCRSRRPRARPG